MSCSNSS